jgi:Holliday junction resolvasome RuvABC endonuclease subunit
VSSAVRVLGVDTGFANIGCLGVEFYSTGGVKAKIAAMITTKKESKKRNLREDADEQRRLDEIRVEFGLLLDAFEPDVSAFEMIPKLRNPTANRNCAAAWGVLFCCCRERGIPVLVYDPQRIKQRVTGNRGASKTDMIKALKKVFPGFKGWPSSAKVEHVVDGGGAALCAEQDPLVEVLRRERGKN